MAALYGDKSICGWLDAPPSSKKEWNQQQGPTDPKNSLKNFQFKVKRHRSSLVFLSFKVAWWWLDKKSDSTDWNLISSKKNPVTPTFRQKITKCSR